MAQYQGKFFQIRSRLNGLVLDIEGNGTSPGTKVVMWNKKPNGENDNQLFYEDVCTDTIRCKHCDFCIEVDGDHLVINPYEEGNENQKWMVARDRVQNTDSPNKVFDVTGNNCEPGAEVCAWDHHGARNQKWVFEYQPAQYFFVRSQLNGKVLDIQGGDAEDGAQVILWDQKDVDAADNQLWWEDRDGLIRSKLNNSTIKSTPQGLEMSAFDPKEEDMGWAYCEGSIRNRNNPSQCFDVEANCMDNGANVIMYEYHGNPNQQFTVEYI